MAQQDNYNDLVDTPNETLSVEYKSWLDLSDNETRADLARHICALANHGGGMIVFGFNDDLTVSGSNLFQKTPTNRDTISAITKKYLDPSLHCDVINVTSTSGTTHPIVVVPSHGSTPICAKASGPVIDGRSRGIALGTHYVRKPGPESERIMSAAEWAPVIRRCALHERANILSAIGAALTGTSGTAPQYKDELKTWHNSAYGQFKYDVEKYLGVDFLARNNVQYSYSIVRDDNQRLDAADLKSALLLQMSNEVKDRVHTGWSMFFPFTRDEISPRFTVDETSGEGQDDFIECALLRDPDLGFYSDMWRLTPTGKATLIRPYWEDKEDWNEAIGKTPGSWFSPPLQMRAMAELVRHAQAFAEKFDAPTSVTFICEWRGLAGRKIFHPDRHYSVPGHATAEHRIITKEVAVASLANSWPDVVSEFLAPVVRLFNTSFEITPDGVRAEAPNWLRF